MFVSSYANRRTGVGLWEGGMTRSHLAADSLPRVKERVAVILGWFHAYGSNNVQSDQVFFFHHPKWMKEKNLST